MSIEPKAPATLLGVGIAEEDVAEIAALPRSRDYRVVTVGTYEEASEPEQCRPKAYIAKAIRAARRTSATGVFGTEDYPPSLLVPTIASSLALPTAPLVAIAHCEHKAWSRYLQKALVPRSVPRFAFVDPRDPKAGESPPLPYPFWLKPVKSSLSVLGFRIGGPEECRRALAQMRVRLPKFVGPFNTLVEGLAAADHLAHIDGFWAVAEELLAGWQCTLEGYVFGGEVTVLGIVDSVRFPNGVSFKRFQYPSRLPRQVQQFMADAARRLMPGLGFDHGMFNIEFFWDPRRTAPKIIEVNSRFSPQFADLFEKVDGFNTYGLVLDLALGRRPDHARRAGRHRTAGSFVLRHFEDRTVTRIPSAGDIARVRDFDDDARVKVRATHGQALSTWPQDSYSFRYGLIHVGGRHLADMRTKAARIAALLDYRFAPTPGRRRRYDAHGDKG
ncbi:MAG: D-alanine--D-alanine ligase [Alphaproteobacteria bacterium]|nr:D-alanine--D-alanine ligase [Alphaproteobacteria bacterium]